MRHVFVVINGTSPHPCVVIVVVRCRQGLRLAAACCRHWGYMGVATRVGGAPRPCVIIGSAWGCGLHYPHRHFGRGALRCALVEGLLYHPIVVVIGDAQQLRLVLHLPSATPSSSWSVAYGNYRSCWQNATRRCDIVAVGHLVRTRVAACIGRAGPTPRPHVGVPSSGVHGSYCLRYRRRRIIVIVVGIACGLQLALAERFLAASSSWLSSGSLASSSWFGSHATHGLVRESQRRRRRRGRHGWDHMWSASEWQRRGRHCQGCTAKPSWWSGTHAACGWCRRSCIVVVVTLAVELSPVTVRSTTARRRRA